MKRKGISLIVLVITIVVIIVLAAAVILAISNNNPIANAKKARDMSDEATREEELKIKQLSSILLPAWNGNTATEFASGIGTENDPYLISSGEELAYFAKLVNEGNYTICGKLTKSLNMGNKEFEIIADSEVNDSSNDGTGITKEFDGTFDGNGNVITGLVINKLGYSYVGLFGALGENGIIKNLNIYQGKISGKLCVGGIVGFNKGKVLNCTNLTNILCTNGIIGGIVGRSDKGQIINCINYVDITFNATGIYQPPTGGIIGLSKDTTIYNCKNYGNIKNDTQQAAGIVGSLKSGNIENCSNYGEISSDNISNNKVAIAGGILGVQTGGNVKNVYNLGKVTISNKYTGKNDRVGGIVGHQNDGKIERAYNKGEVVGEEGKKIGGVIGIQGGGTVEKCYYYGELQNVIGADLNSNVVINDVGKVEHVEINIESYEDFLEWIKNK